MFEVRFKNSVVKFHKIQPFQVIFCSSSLQTEGELWHWVPGYLAMKIRRTTELGPVSVTNTSDEGLLALNFLLGPLDTWPSVIELSSSKCDEECITLTTRVNKFKLVDINRFSNYSSFSNY